MTSADCAGLALAFPGDSEMASRMRAHPWAETALGEPSAWPGSLSVACRLCLTSRFPMVLWWGEIWQIIGSQLRSVLDTGQATYSQDMLLPLNRGGFLEETYYTYSFSPLYDDAGVVRGVFTVATDRTDGIVGARRLSVLNELGGVAGRARHVPEAFEMIGDVLGRSGQDVPFAAAYLHDPGSDELAPRVVSPAGAMDGLTAAARAGWPVPPADAMVLPLTADLDNPAIGAIVLAASAGRPLDEGYSSFLTLVAQQTAAVINSALAYQVQQNRAEELAELDRAKTVFFSNISHEFRTPLALIMGPAAELQDKLAGAAPAIGHDLGLIQRNGMRQLAPVRAALRQWLARCDLTERTAQDVLIAAGEAVANAYEHGSGGASGQPISLSASATGTDLYLTVTDSGRWKDSAPVPGAYRGHGLPLMRTLMTEVTVHTDKDGTTVRMQLRIAP